MTKTLTTERLREILERRSPSLRWGEAEQIAAELLANRGAQPVEWGSPKTVGQMIGQLKTLDPAMETTALLRMPPDILDGNAVRQVPISISFEKLNGQWLAPYKGEGRKVLAFWAKADHREEGERGDLLTAPPAPAVPEIDELRLAFERAERESDDGFNLHKYGISYADEVTQVRWESWLACRAAMLAKPVSQGCKLVPVPTVKKFIPFSSVSSTVNGTEPFPAALTCEEAAALDGTIFLSHLKPGGMVQVYAAVGKDDDRELIAFNPKDFKFTAPEGGN